MRKGPCTLGLPLSGPSFNPHSFSSMAPGFFPEHGAAACLSAQPEKTSRLAGIGKGSDKWTQGTHKVRLFFFFLHHVSSLVVSDSFVSPWTAAPPGPSVLGIFQVRILQWIAISSSRASSQPRDRTCVSCIGRRILYHCITWEALLMKYTLIQT